MIICSQCDSAQTLQITQSRVYFEDGEVEELEEAFTCTLCNSEGELKVWTEEGVRRTSIEGEIEETEDRPMVAL